MERINNTPVSKDEIIEIVQEIAEREPGDRDAEGHMLVITSLHHNNPDKGQSIYFRLEALAQFLTQEGATGWTLELPNGATLTQEPVFAAAAVHPLSERDGELVFERESFLKKVLELADLDRVG